MYVHNQSLIFSCPLLNVKLQLHEILELSAAI